VLLKPSFGLVRTPTHENGTIQLTSSYFRGKWVTFRVNLQVLDQSIDTSDTTGRLLFNMFSAISHFEIEIYAERQMDGIQKAQHNRSVSVSKECLAPY
jgi:hypothetical protein